MKIGRNDPCPCGSGKKYKKCCGKNDKVISLSEAQIGKEEDIFIESFFVYLYENWTEELTDEFLEIKSHPPLELDEVMEDDDFAFLFEAFAFHKEVKNGLTPLELFIDKQLGEFNSATLNYFREYFKMYYSIYKTVAITPDWIVLEDVFLNKIHRVDKEDFLEEVEVDDFLFCQLTNNEGLQEVFFNIINISDYSEPYIELFHNLFAESGLDDYQEFLIKNSYSLVKTVLAKENELNDQKEGLRYAFLHTYAITWLLTPQKFLEDIPPLLAIDTLQGKNKIINYLENPDDPFLLDEEKELLIASKEIIKEQLGFVPGKITPIEDYQWESPIYKESAEEILENSFKFLTPYQLSQAVKMWFDFSKIRKPRIVKPEVWVAVINYTLLQIEFLPELSQREIAEEYGISVATLGKNFRELKEYLDIEKYSTGKFPVPFKFMDLVTVVPNDNFVQGLIDQAWDADEPEEKIFLARKAIKIDPDAVDAYVILGNEAETWEEALEYYQLGVQAGERSLGAEYFKKNKGHFWGLLETRPYMRTKYGLAEALWKLGERKMAVKHMLEMLELNPNDNQGVRDILSGYLIVIGDDKEFIKLYQNYNDDCVHFNYNYALYLFKKYGDVPESRKALKKAMQQNKYVLDYLLSLKKVPKDLPLFYSMGSKEEAIIYINDIENAWELVPGALSWLKRNLWLC